MRLKIRGGCRRHCRPDQARRKKKRASIPTELKYIGDEINEQLDIEPAKIKLVRQLRKKYACPCCEKHLIIAKNPAQPIEKSIVLPRLFAYIAVSEYCDALPLYRKINIFKRIDVELDRTTSANWIIKTDGLVQPLINRLQDVCEELAVLHIDETSLQALNEPGEKVRSQSYI